MIWLAVVVGIVVIVSFGLPVLFGPPYVPTLRLNMNTALDLLDLKAGQTLLDLGSGDGRILVAGAKRGLNVVGIELSLFLVIVSWFRTRRYRKQVKIIWGNYFYTNWPPADGIFSFMIQYQMKRLDNYIIRWQEWHKHPVRLASFAFQIPDKKVVAQRDAVFLYEYK
jgi:cyclopropane fatty-acyl-phospholipid synthase-like methyltransferase